MFQILVVEDDRELNRTVCAFLNASGYRATGCLDANSAYDAMYGTVFDLIVSDIMMPGIDGFEFAKTVRSLNGNIPILFMTARDDFASKQRGYRIGVDDYMVKPIDLDELFLRIGALLRRAKIASSRKLEVGAFSMDMDERIATLPHSGSHKGSFRTGMTTTDNYYIYDFFHKMALYHNICSYQHLFVIM